MKIKIITCKNAMYWYSGLTGHYFNIKEDAKFHKEHWFLEGHPSPVDKDDTEIVKETEVAGDWAEAAAKEISFDYPDEQAAIDAWCDWEEAGSKVSETAFLKGFHAATARAKFKLVRALAAETAALGKLDACEKHVKILQARQPEFAPARSAWLMSGDVGPARDKIDRLTTELAAARERCAKYERFILSHHNSHFYGDHACSQCYPGADGLIPGFVCAFHVAKAALAAGCPKEGV